MSRLKTDDEKASPAKSDSTLQWICANCKKVNKYEDEVTNEKFVCEACGAVRSKMWVTTENQTKCSSSRSLRLCITCRSRENDNDFYRRMNGLLNKNEFQLNPEEQHLLGKKILLRGYKEGSIDFDYTHAKFRKEESLATALHLLLMHQPPDRAYALAKVFLSLGANPNALAKFSRTPFHFAMIYQNNPRVVDICKLMLEYKGDPTLRETMKTLCTDQSRNCGAVDLSLLK